MSSTEGFFDLSSLPEADRKVTLAQAYFSNPTVLQDVRNQIAREIPLTAGELKLMSTLAWKPATIQQLKKSFPSPNVQKILEKLDSKGMLELTEAPEDSVIDYEKVTWTTGIGFEVTWYDLSQVGFKVWDVIEPYWAEHRELFL
jgi:hypothetical protein